MLFLHILNMVHGIKRMVKLRDDIQTSFAKLPFGPSLSFTCCITSVSVVHRLFLLPLQMRLRRHSFHFTLVNVVMDSPGGAIFA